MLPCPAAWARAPFPPMPSPALQLRAPLLWLLLPLMAGLVAARHWPPPAAGLWPFIAGAGVAAFTALGLARHQRTGWWMACLGLSVGLSGYALLHARHPGLHLWDSRPPREITVTLEVWQAFPAAPKARTLSGLATIIATGENDRELTGRRVYFSAIRRISVPPQRSGRYLIRASSNRCPAPSPPAVSMTTWSTSASATASPGRRCSARSRPRAGSGFSARPLRTGWRPFCVTVWPHIPSRDRSTSPCCSAKRPC